MADRTFNMELNYRCFLEIVYRDSGNKSLSNINMELLTWS